MPKISRKINTSDEKFIRRFVEKKVISSADFNPCCLTKELFIIITLYGSAVMSILILFITLNALTFILINEKFSIRDFPGVADYSVNKNKPAEKITYAVDKTRYGLNEEIKLSITNESSKSIFLVPCQYFNTFEKRENNSWKPVLLDNCGAVTAPSPDIFEKIPIKEKQNISAVALGEGIWRGVSNIYTDCQKAEISSCKGKKVVYSNEFKIEAQKN